MKKKLYIFISTWILLFAFVACDDRPDNINSYYDNNDTNNTENNNSDNHIDNNDTDGTENNNSASDSIENNTPVETPVDTVLEGSITTNILLTADKIWSLEGVVSITSGATLTIEAGTTIAGDENTYLIIDKNSKIMAEGTDTKPIIFTSTKVALDGSVSASGQWGGLAIIGNAGNAQVEPYEANTAFTASSTNLQDNSGILRHVKILHSGLEIAEDKKINGLSLVGVGSGTTIEEITVDFSSADGIQIWGGTVNLTNIDIQNCADDYLDIDDGYSGTISKLFITQNGGKAGIEISGQTSPSIDAVTITQNQSEKEGLIFFDGDGAGGHFTYSIFNDNTDNGYGAIHALGLADIANTSFTNILLMGNSADNPFTQEENTDGSAQALEDKFDLGSDNLK